MPGPVGHPDRPPRQTELQETGGAPTRGGGVSSGQARWVPVDRLPFQSEVPEQLGQSRRESRFDLRFKSDLVRDPSLDRRTILGIGLQDRPAPERPPQRTARRSLDCPLTLPAPGLGTGLRQRGHHLPRLPTPVPVERQGGVLYQPHCRVGVAVPCSEACCDDRGLPGPGVPTNRLQPPPRRRSLGPPKIVQSEHQLSARARGPPAHPGDALLRQLWFAATEPQAGQEQTSLVGGFQPHRPLGRGHGLVHAATELVAAADMNLELSAAISASGSRRCLGVPRDRLVPSLPAERTAAAKIGDLLPGHRGMADPVNTLQQWRGLLIERVPVQCLGDPPLLDG